MTIIHANVYNPSTSLFKTKANTRSECQTITCKNAECPLLARGQCTMRGSLLRCRCPYGVYKCETGPTKRAKNFHSWIRDKKEQYKNIPFLQIPPNRMEFIGDYVLLPYSHMTMCESVQFKSRSGFLSSGDPFLPREFWTLETVLSLLNFRPQALMGGEIISYQKEEIPKFLLHLRECDKNMWQQLIDVRPQLNTIANHVGRKAILSTLNHPIEWTETSNYPVHWKWDGTILTTNSIHSYNKTWGNVDVQSVVIHATPSPRAEIVVKSNEWVNELTEFTT